MPARGAVVKFDDRKLRTIVARAPALVTAVLDKTAFDVVRLAKNRVPVDTSRTKNSIVVHKIVDPLSRRIGPDTGYAIFLEFGTFRMAARPYMVPALEGIRAPFIAALSAIYARVR